MGRPPSEAGDYASTIAVSVAGMRTRWLDASAQGIESRAGLTVTAPSVTFTTTIRSLGEDGSSSRYLANTTATDRNGRGIGNAEITFRTTQGTLDSADSDTTLSGEANAIIRTQASGPATITVTSPGLGACGSVQTAFQVGPVPSFPAGRAIRASCAGAGMDVNPQGTLIATASERNITVLDPATGETRD